MGDSTETSKDTVKESAPVKETSTTKSKKSKKEKEREKEKEKEKETTTIDISEDEAEPVVKLPRRTRKDKVCLSFHQSHFFSNLLDRRQLRLRLTPSPKCPLRLLSVPRVVPL